MQIEWTWYTLHQALEIRLKFAVYPAVHIYKTPERKTCSDEVGRLV